MSPEFSTVLLGQFSLSIGAKAAREAAFGVGTILQRAKIGKMDFYN